MCCPRLTRSALLPGGANAAFVRDQSLSDAMLEVWRPSVRGASPGASPPGSQPGEEAQELLAKQGFGRVRVEESGCFCFRVWPFAQVVKGHAPHLVVHVFMRGLLKAASTRIYLPDQVGHETDPVLKRVPSTRRSTLIASQVDEEPNRFRFDIHMQGANETVFFAY